MNNINRINSEGSGECLRIFIPVSLLSAFFQVN